MDGYVRVKNSPVSRIAEVIERMREFHKIVYPLQNISGIKQLNGKKTALFAAFFAVMLVPGPVLQSFVPGLASQSAARAETLAQALGSAYRTNPELDAERARLRATDEQVSQANSGYRPSLNASADVGYRDSRSKPSSAADGSSRPKGYSINATQSIFRGFRTVNTVRAAEANVRAGRQLLRQTEQKVLLSAVQVFVDVIRDKAIVRLRENNVRVLSRELKATKDRFAVGEVTRTDVAQARARRALAVSAQELARANLHSSRASYRQIVGHAPGRLRSAMPHRRLLPRSRRQATSIALQESPDLIRAQYLEQAARHNVSTIRGELLPTAQIDGSYSKRYDSSPLSKESGVGTITGRLTFPIYQSGAVYARIRQAKHIHVSTLQVVQQTRNQVRANAERAWSQLSAARAAVLSDRAAVGANQIALNGVREEERVGQRTLLDVLNAQQELLNSQVILATDQRNLVFASYNLLSSLGRLIAQELAVAKNVYEPEVHYNDVRRKWWGLRITHPDGTDERMNLWNSLGRRHPSSK